MHQVDNADYILKFNTFNPRYLCIFIEIVLRFLHDGF